METGLDVATGLAIEDVMDARTEDRPPLCTLDDGALALSMALEIAEAAASGCDAFRPFASLH
jgi:ATP-dependent protease ClpP protease subunit